MNRIHSFSKALDRCSQYQEKEPGGWLWRSLIEQLEFLLALERGETVDRSLLARICIGAMAAKNVEDRDEALAMELYAIQEEADQMNEERH